MTNPPAPNFKLTAVPLYRERLMLAVGQGHDLAGRKEISQEELGVSVRTLYNKIKDFGLEG